MKCRGRGRDLLLFMPLFGPLRPSAALASALPENDHTALKLCFSQRLKKDYPHLYL